MPSEWQEVPASEGPMDPEEDVIQQRMQDLMEQAFDHGFSGK